MSTTPGGPPASPSSATPKSGPGGRLRAALEANMRSGANWFLILAVLSVVNSALEIFHAQIRFIFGLGVTRVVDEVAAHAGPNGHFLVLTFNGAFLLILVLCGLWARKGSQGAFLAGLILYALDGVLLLYFAVWLDAAVHAYALFRLWQGFSACRELAAAGPDGVPGMS